MSESMATKFRQDKFSIALLVLVLIASALLFYSENPFAFDFSGNSRPASSGQVSVYVIPNEDASNGGQTQDGGGTGT